MSKVTITNADLDQIVLRQASSLALCMTVRSLNPSDEPVFEDMLRAAKELAGSIFKSYGIDIDAKGSPAAPVAEPAAPKDTVLHWPPRDPKIPPLPDVYIENLYELRESVAAHPVFTAGTRVCFTGKAHFDTAYACWMMQIRPAASPDSTEHEMLVPSRILKPTEEESPLSPNYGIMTPEEARRDLLLGDD